MTELEKFLTSLYDAVLQAEVTAQSHGQAAYTLLQASPSPSQRDSRIPVYHATNISIDLDVGLEAREENGVTRMYVTDRPEDETAISFDLEVYDFIEPSDQPDLGDLPIEGGDGGGGGEGSGGGGGGFPFARPDIGSDPPWNVNEEVLRTRLLEQAGEDVGESARESTDEGSEGGGRGDESEDGGQGDERTRDDSGDDGGDEADGGSPGDGGDGEDGGSEDDGGVGGSADSESDGSGDSGEATEAGDDGSGGGSEGGGDGSGGGSEGGDDGSGGGSEGSEGGNESGDGPFDDLPEFDNPVIDPRDRIREFTGDNDEVTNDE